LYADLLEDYLREEKLAKLYSTLNLKETKRKVKVKKYIRKLCEKFSRDEVLKGIAFRFSPFYKLNNREPQFILNPSNFKRFILDAMQNFFFNEFTLTFARAF